MNIVFIHGRSQGGKNPVELQKTWEQTLDVGLANAGLKLSNETKILFPFYGDLLDELITKIEIPTVDAAIMKGLPIGDPIAKFQGELLEDLARDAQVPDAAIQKAFKGQVTQKGVQNWEWVQAILEALDNSTVMGRAALETFTRDVYCYLKLPGIAKAIHAIVKPMLLAGPCVVVAHSLGSIVAYRLLRELQDQVDVRGLVTVGSPLGVNAVRNRILPPVLAMPGNAHWWYNAYDERDVVALKGLTQDNWPINPAIENSNHVLNHTENRHGIIGYLDDIKVASKIYNAL
jgi:hypothetical protein